MRSFEPTIGVEVDEFGKSFKEFRLGYTKNPVERIDTGVVDHPYSHIFRITDFRDD